MDEQVEIPRFSYVVIRKITINLLAFGYQSVHY